MVRGAVLLAAAACLAACSDGPGARAAVEAYGLSDVRTTGYELTGCGDDDSIRTGFEATNARGDRVHGVVCDGGGPFGKAATVRIFGVLHHAGAR